MGFSITWFAVPEAHSDSFLQHLGLVPTGETGEYPDSLISSARLDTGWRMLWYNKYECPFLGEKELSSLSHHHDVIACTVEEHCMDSTATLWRLGLRHWFIHHDGSGGAKGFEATGTLPACFDSIRSELEQKQAEAGGTKADVDYLFDIPLAVAQSIVGFKHDEDSPHVIDGTFHVLTQISTATEQSQSQPKRGFFGRLFGS
jgi:hypothetical protein